MIRTELRKWDFIDNDKEWKEWRDGLSKRDSSNYSKFMSYRSHLVKTEKRIDKLNEQLQLEKDNVRDYLSKLTDINSKIDHLRREFNLSLSVSVYVYVYIFSFFFFLYILLLSLSVFFNLIQ